MQQQNAAYTHRSRSQARWVQGLRVPRRNREVDMLLYQLRWIVAGLLFKASYVVLDILTGKQTYFTAKVGTAALTLAMTKSSSHQHQEI
ncbi:hypothetical protein BDV29DRAFT_138114 [Aspergillus leporis]|uniref:Uncharacterized protein n=1 Tax=Aspergillus leporis TaxID=41062 RepID=A0A5N5WXS3_9EURO|nr:hypothetical protein BDV29DRAFT_138114 [Aspergillus leporis]